MNLQRNSGQNVYFLHLQVPLKGHKYTHAENEVQADDDDDDNDDDGYGVV